MTNPLRKESRVLLAELVRTDFKLRYQGSVLGYLWSLLRPLLLFSVLYIVFDKFLKLGQGIPNFAIYLLLGIVLWAFFSDMTNQSLGSIVSRGSLIRKIRIPRWLIVVSSSISALINLGFNLIVVLIFIIIVKIDLLQTALWLPLILLEVYILGLGMSLILATAFVKFRDVKYIWEVVLQAGFYATPILYPLNLVPEAFQKVLILSPMAQSIQDARYSVVTHETLTIYGVYGSSIYRLIPIAIPIVLLVIGVLYFKKQAGNFAEDI
ncbi:MAG TPA: ABC transporter permease [Candidatus Saccharimonadales bacterium]|nr:ABC transporter permease [Candidatus Saccharimonadales bacterium]